MIPATAGNNGQVAKGSFVALDRPAERPGGEIFGQGPVQFGGMRARNPPDVVRDFQAAHPFRRLQQPALGRSNGEGDVGPDGRSFHLPAVRVETGGHIHGEHGQAGLIDGINQSPPRFVQRAVEADAEQGVNDPRWTMMD